MNLNEGQNSHLKKIIKIHIQLIMCLHMAISIIVNKIQKQVIEYK